jgi:two-component system, NtrC family, sensor kinase
MHPLLKRQLKKQFLREEDVPETLHPFVAAIDSAYAKFESDYQLLYHSLDVMSRELNERNEALRHERDEQKELVKRLGEATNQLLQSEKMASIGQLAAGVAHEINNPIGYINSNINALDDYIKDLMTLIGDYESAHAALDPATRDRIERLREKLDIDYLKGELPPLVSQTLEGLTRVRRIVQDLKNFSHADTGTFVWTDLRQGLESTINIATNEIKYRADVIREYADIPDVECLPSQLNQVFMNLVVNAAHAIPDDRRGTITVRTGQCCNDSVFIEIIDDGSGIPPENLTRIFDPFFTTKPVGKGTGLGLSLSYGIVQKHNGEIKVSSTPGKGSTFQVILPVRRPTS